MLIILFSQVHIEVLRTYLYVEGAKTPLIIHSKTLGFTLFQECFIT